MKVPIITDAQRYALVIMAQYENESSPPYGWCPITHHGTGRYDGQPWINNTTARSLQSKGLIQCLWEGPDSECQLTDLGRTMALVG